MCIIPSFEVRVVFHSDFLINPLASVQEGTWRTSKCSLLLQINSAGIAKTALIENLTSMLTNFWLNASILF